jgi:hypothetical protein
MKSRRFERNSAPNMNIIVATFAAGGRTCVPGTTRIDSPADTPRAFEPEFGTLFNLWPSTQHRTFLRKLIGERKTTHIRVL